METNKEMQSFAARFSTFQIAHQLSKRRASAQSSKKRGGGNTIEWPHERPAPEDLARAGFFYRPAQDSTDNVQCFLCSVKLDGWEPNDDPLKEHLAHSRSCNWALSLHAGISAQQQDECDPMSTELIAARKGTFEAGAGWPHEGKRGWKCKISKMVEAGWCLDPAPGGEEEDGDGVTCFYCNLSLDGWEPKDDPLEEHKRRSPECAFFALLEKFGGVDGKIKKGKGKGKGGRASNASTASRLSSQSALSTFSDAPSFASLGAGESVEASVDHSVMSTATTASQATVTGASNGKKRGGRPKAAAKGAKGRKRANTVESEPAAEPLYPDLSAQATLGEENLASSQPVPVDEPAQAPAKKARKGTRQSKQQLDSSVIEISSFDIAPPKKVTRGRKAKAQPEPEPEPEQEAEGDSSEVSAQLQEELERSMDMDARVDESRDATPLAEPMKPKRGVKRTSDGLKKKQKDVDATAVLVEFPLPPKPAPATKGKKGGKTSKRTTEEGEVDVLSQLQAPTQDHLLISEPEIESTIAAGPKKTLAKKGGRGKKASSARSSRSSKATIAGEPDQPQCEPEDLERDEREIEAELERIAAQQQAIQAEQESTAEFEASPSHARKHVEEIRQLEQELQAEVEAIVPGKNMANFVASVAGSPPLQPAHLLGGAGKENGTPSPSGSDKENQPSSIIQPLAKQQAHPAPILSPTKTTRIPLAPGTPNRSSPKRTGLLSPSKQLSHLTSTRPWETVDLETVFLVAAQEMPGSFSQRLAGAVRVLPSPEKGLTVESWVRYQAEKGEEELRRRCEEMVGAFEREGIRALESLHGIGVDG